MEFVLSIAVLLMAITAFRAVGYAVERKPNEHLNYYPQTAVVVECDEQHDAVTVRTSFGWLYQFYGIEDFEVGDMVAMMMDDMDTGNSVFDDVIVGVHYVGTASDFEVNRTLLTY